MLIITPKICVIENWQEKLRQELNKEAMEEEIIVLRVKKEPEEMIFFKGLQQVIKYAFFKKWRNVYSRETQKFIEVTWDSADSLVTRKVDDALLENRGFKKRLLELK